MKKNVLLIILMVFLMVMNGVLLYLVVQKPNKKPRPPKTFISDRLDFNEEQMAKFTALDEEHHQRMRHIDRQSRELKEVLFSNISHESDTETKIDSIIDRIGELAAERELEIFNHFSRIEKICNEAQKKKLRQILRGALRHGKPGERPPRGEGPPPR